MSTPSVTTSPADTSAPATAAPTQDSDGLDTFAAPATLDGMSPATDPFSVLMKNSVLSAMTQKGSTGTAQAYAASGSADSFIIIGIPAAVPDAQNVVEHDFVNFAASSTFPTGSPTTYDPGSFGALQCAPGKLHAGPVTKKISVCIAADQGGIVVTMYFNHKVDATATLTQMALLTFKK